MTRGHLRLVLGTSAVLAVVATLAPAADPPQLGKSPTKDVVAAMTREEKVATVSTAVGPAR